MGRLSLFARPSSNGFFRSFGILRIMCDDFKQVTCSSIVGVRIDGWIHTVLLFIIEYQRPFDHVLTFFPSK